MAKKGLNKWILTAFMVAGSVAIFAIGTMFWGGSFLNSIGLKYVWEWVHKTIGALLMISGVGGVISSFIRK